MRTAGFRTTEVIAEFQSKFSKWLVHRYSPSPLLKSLIERAKLAIRDNELLEFVKLTAREAPERAFGYGK